MWWIQGNDPADEAGWHAIGSYIKEVYEGKWHEGEAFDTEAWQKAYDEDRDKFQKAFTKCKKKPAS